MRKLYAVLGDPIGHSMSPVMLNDLFSFYQVDAHYLPFQVKAEDLGEAVKGLKALGVGGFNVTIPHKSAIIPYLDVVDELALSIGAVNTVVNEGGKLIGYNTDGPGFLRSLNPFVPSVSDQRILLIGAGGAARGIYFALAKEKPLVIDIANRTLERAMHLIAECPYDSPSKALSLQEASKNIGEYDLIVQTTMIGMSPKIAEQPLSLDNLAKQSVVCDIIYNPLETQLLRDAASKGARTQTGVDMFVYQGALAFEKWTGIFPNVGRMRNNVLKQLGGNQC
ncbi:shikimate dehydrogenase [Neobacillus sp. MM2021_6]|uniref:shikimate dehydrogenase n=1 Tax=Bacillaceae TaxID=186817 RepID=UPI00140AB8C3|nr:MULTISPECIES: shikimate dehydrogenase [Bacillaceae]MBO0959424.1 shikimate dehydrogenase [Neobacillus sp. MM2021_6]NHC17278.1 shikimate dehydrogenase [Bacillus sp. MM2020_4]WML40633.1 shikimate dehydrogenase [Neobacillus sp. OS1-2]